jgi:hypothetical protein
MESAESKHRITKQLETEVEEEEDDEDEGVRIIMG